MPRDHAIFKKSLENLPDGVCQDCRQQFIYINRDFDTYKYELDRQEDRIFLIHTDCLKFILQRIEKFSAHKGNLLDICKSASESKRICEDCHAEIKEKISDLMTKLHSDSNTKMISTHASCLAGLFVPLAEDKHNIKTTDANTTSPV